MLHSYTHAAPLGQMTELERVMAGNGLAKAWKQVKCTTKKWWWLLTWPGIDIFFLFLFLFLFLLLLFSPDINLYNDITLNLHLFLVTIIVSCTLFWYATPSQTWLPHGRQIFDKVSHPFFFPCYYLCHQAIGHVLRANAPCSVSGLLADYYTVAPSHCLSYP